MSNYDYNELRVLTHKTIKVMNKITDIELKEINKVIEVLTAYKEGKIIEFYVSKDNIWIKCITTPFISVMSTDMYRIINEEENIETYE